MKKYQPSQIEPKWQKKWSEDKLYLTDLTKTEKEQSSRTKYYVLVELPYTSGDLHIGHWFTFSKGDILARFKKMQGFNVIFPNGYDTFGLPAENAAIRNKMHPKDWTYANINRMREQFNAMGTSIDWTKTAITCEPEYYKWNQWIFLKMYEKGVAYKGKTISNWCPSCQTVLADENVEAGKCWRCGTEVEKKEIDQWFLKITDYANQLIWQDDDKYDWPKALKDAQNKWIGKSEGVIIDFEGIEVFTTRPDTIFGATFLILSPEHPKVKQLTTPNQSSEVEKYLLRASKKSEQERKENKEKTGVFTGSYLENPLNKEKIPVWIADYVLMGYGTGAIMAVPGHDARDFEFAQKYNLPIQTVVAETENSSESLDNPYEGEGVLVDSGKFTGLESAQAREKISDYIVNNHLGRMQVNYHLHDWSVSRQRYWGTPIPIIYCPNCGTQPVPYQDLPVVLPDEVDFAPKGKAPLATAEDWVKVKCPKCGGQAQREVETMDGFVDNSWYFYRYLDPQNKTEIFDKDIITSWMPIEIYIGGAEHTFGHALYSRFFTKFFKDIGLVNFDEYTLKRVHHGVVLGPDGHRMSKSRGNVVNPDEQALKFGADAVRVYLSFLGPPDIVTAWVPEGLNGIYHFLQRAWGLFEKVGEVEITKGDLSMMHKTIKKVTQDLSKLANNTAIAALMEWLNLLSRKERISKDEFRTYLLLLAPFAPFITEELWQMLGEDYSIHTKSWPKFDEKYLKEAEVTIVIQVNGKVRDQLKVNLTVTEDEILKLANGSEKVQKFLKGLTVKKTIYVPGRVVNIVV